MAGAITLFFTLRGHTHILTYALTEMLTRLCAAHVTSWGRQREVGVEAGCWVAGEGQQTVSGLRPRHWLDRNKECKAGQRVAGRLNGVFAEKGTLLRKRKRFKSFLGLSWWLHYQPVKVSKYYRGIKNVTTIVVDMMPEVFLTIIRLDAARKCFFAASMTNEQNKTMLRLVHAAQSPGNVGIVAVLQTTDTLHLYAFM